MRELPDNKQADVVEAFNSTSRYLDDLLNIHNPYFEQMVSYISHCTSVLEDILHKQIV